MERAGGRAVRHRTEMTGDPAFARRVGRLVLVSAVALGLIFLLAVTTLDVPFWIATWLAVGWVLMPWILWFSLRLPRLRYGLLLPASLVGVALVALCATALPADATARAGWLMITAGVLVGAVLGSWFWFRWLPVPRPLDDPFSPARWLLVIVHAGLAVGGMALVMVAALG